MKNYRMKTVFKGTQEVARTNGGEVERAALFTKQKQDLNFLKWFIPTEGYRMYPKEMIVSARDVFEYLMVVSDKQNIAIAPTSEMEERLNISLSSISRGRSQLLGLDFIRLRSNSVYMINPAIACKVDGDKRDALMEVYHSYPRANADK